MTTFTNQEVPQKTYVFLDKGLQKLKLWNFYPIHLDKSKKTHDVKQMQIILLLKLLRI